MQARHLIICINSFNDSTYSKYALDLINQVKTELNGRLTFSILCAVGGCESYNIRSLDSTTTYVDIPQNLSDHNIYLGMYYYHSLHGLPERATCVMLHDTCMVKPVCFRNKMMCLNRFDIRGWVFAHALGLYNIGVCDVHFALTHSQKWLGISHLDKATGITLEHSRGSVEVQPNRFVPGLRSYSNKTLSGADNDKQNINDVDYHSITPIRAENGKTRHVVFLGSLGVYKFTHSPGSFTIPIWVNEFAPKSEDEYVALSSNEHVKAHEWVRALVPFSFVQSSGTLDPNGVCPGQIAASEVLHGS